MRRDVRKRNIWHTRQLKLWWACASAQSDQSPVCPNKQILHPWLSEMRQWRFLSDCEKIHANQNLRWAHVQRYVFWRCGSFVSMIIYTLTHSVMCLQITVLSTSLGKTFFAWRFILNENILFWLTIYYQKLFVFSVSVFSSRKITIKLNLRPQISVTDAISIVKWLFWNFCIRQYVFTFLCWIWITSVSQHYCGNFRKHWTSETCYMYLPYRYLHNLHSFLIWGKAKLFEFLKKQWLE